MSSEKIDLEVPSSPLSLAVIRRVVAKAAVAAGLSHERVQALQLAIGEAATNVIEHAYGAEYGTIHIRAARVGTAYTVEIEDSGRWRGSRHLVGRGIAVMRALVEEVDIERNHSGTIVRLTVTSLPAETQS